MRRFPSLGRCAAVATDAETPTGGPEGTMAHPSYVQRREARRLTPASAAAGDVRKQQGQVRFAALIR